MSAIKKLAIITSHPIQYNAPVFRMLAERKVVDIKVFYTWGEEAIGAKYDPGFGQKIEWDLPLLDGYQYEFLQNISKDPGTHHFKGIINPDIISRVNSWQPNALLIYGWPFKSHLKLMRKFIGKIPILFRGDSTLLNEGKGIKKIIRLITLTWVYRHIDFALYTGKHNYDYFRKFGLKEKQLRKAPHTIDNARFSAFNKEQLFKANEMRKQLSIPASDFVFLFCGKLEPNKNPLLLLEAFKASGLTNQAHLVFVGSGELEMDLRTTATNFASVHFIGFQNQMIMPVIYRLGQVFVLPSQSETWGLAINEAMACGRPVIASNKCGGAPDLVDQGKNGYIFESGNLESLKSYLIKIFKEKDRWAEMSNRSLEIISSFSNENLCQTIENVINNK